jgi:23S rRNA-/tRNA-specific pseudouridylate synthase
MKGKYITNEMLMIFYSQRKTNRKSIHEQLEETIAERKNILRQYELKLAGDPSAAPVTIHAELEKTVAELKKAKRQYKRLFEKEPETSGKIIYLEPGNIAA